MTEVADLVREDGTIDARRLNTGRTEATIDAATCAAMRAAVADGYTLQAIADRHDVADTTVRYHTSGQCSHGGTDE